MESLGTSNEQRKLDRSSKRYSFSFYGFRKNTGDTALKRSISVSSVSSPTLLNEQQLQELPPLLSNSIYHNQGFNDRKRGSYALCQSLQGSLDQLSSSMTLTNGHILIVPSIVMKCCEYILSHELLEGLFRVNASIRKIKRLEQLINERLLDHRDFQFEEFISEAEEIEEINSYDVSMILKRYLNNLDDHLVDHTNYSKFVKNHESLMTVTMHTPSPAQPMSSNSSRHSVLSAVNSQFSQEESPTPSTTCTEEDANNGSDNIVNTQEALKIDARDLSTNVLSPKLHLLLYILNFLHQLTISDEIISKTKMSSLNLSKIFQPSLFEFKVEKQSSTENLLDFYKVNELILWRWIDNFKFLDDCLFREIVTSNLRATPLSTPSPQALTPVGSLDSPDSFKTPQLTQQISNPKTRDTFRESVTTREEKKQRRRTIFGYRSFSTPNPLQSSTTTQEPISITGSTKPRVVSASNESKRFTLKRLPTAIFGSSYSLKAKLAPQLLPKLVEQSPRDTALHSPLSDEVSSKQVKQRRRVSLYGFDFQKSKTIEKEEEPPIAKSNEEPFGLQRMPLFAQDIKFNQSPMGSSVIEQLSTFQETPSILN